VYLNFVGKLAVYFNEEDFQIQCMRIVCGTKLAEHMFACSRDLYYRECMEI